MVELIFEQLAPDQKKRIEFLEDCGHFFFWPDSSGETVVLPLTDDGERVIKQIRGRKRHDR